MRIISCAGQMGMGKDTLCDYLVDLLNENGNIPWQRAAFADAVKNTFCTAFNVTREFIENWKRSPEAPPGFKMPIRKGLQNIGDGFRQIVDDIWIQIALRTDKNIIISDGRYINEAKAVSEKNGLNILVYRDGFLNDDPNPSESQLKPILEYARDHLRDGVIDHSNLVNPPVGLEYFHLFLRNENSRNDFLQKGKEILLPSILMHFR